jgi:hypothetical protein
MLLKEYSNVFNVFFLLLLVLVVVRFLRANIINTVQQQRSIVIRQANDSFRLITELIFVANTFVFTQTKRNIRMITYVYVHMSISIIESYSRN